MESLVVDTRNTEAKGVAIGLVTNWSPYSIVRISLLPLHGMLRGWS